MKQVFRPKESIKSERVFVTIYGILALLVGVFLSTFDILAHAVFLDSFGYKYLATSYIGAGAIGLVISYLYSIVYRKVHIKRLNLIVMSFILAIVAIYLYQLVFSPTTINAYLGMVMLFPVNSFMIFALWRIGRKLLTHQQSKVRLPRLKIMHISGWIIGGLSTSALLYLSLTLTDIALYALVSLLLLWFVQLILFKTHSNRIAYFSSGKDVFVPVSKNVFLFFTSRFASSLYIFCLLSAIVGFSIHYAFINVASAGFQSVIGLSKFYGLYLAFLMIFILGIDKFLIRRILYSYDSPYSIVIIPFTILLAVALAVTGFHFLAKYQAYEHFTYYFLLLVITKVGIESLQQIVQVPSLRVLFQSMDIRYRQVVYPRIEVSVIMMGVLITGLVILPLTFLDFFTLTIVLYWVLFVSIVWAVFGVILLKQYRKQQDRILERMRFNKSYLVSEAAYSERLWSTLTGNNYIKIKHILKVLSEVRPAIYENYLPGLLTHHDDRVKKHTINRIIRDRVTELTLKIKEIAVNEKAEVKEQLDLAIQDMEAEKLAINSYQSSKEVLLSGDVKTRIKLANSLSGKEDENSRLLLFELAKDLEPQVQNSALKYLARLRAPGFNYMLLDFLYPEKFNAYALNVITKSGNEALDYLEREQMLPEVPDLVQARIMFLYARIGSRQAIDKILTNINNLDRFVLLQSLQSLINIQFQVDASNKYKILNLVVKQVGVITRNLGYYQLLRNKKQYAVLAEAYRLEVDFNYDLLFKFLSLVYNQHVIASLQRIFLDGSHSEINHGIELSDQYFEEELKLLLFPLFENLTIKERIKRLEHYFLQPKTKAKDIVRITLTADYNNLSLFPRACAMMYIYQKKLGGFEDELIFNAYHKESILSETALYILAVNHPQRLDILREEERFNKKLTGQISSVRGLEEKELFYYRFQGLKKYSVFNQFSEFVALKLASYARQYKLEADEFLNVSELKDRGCLLLTRNRILIAEDESIVTSYNNFLEIDILLGLGIGKVKSELENEYWVFPCKVVKELITDHVDFLDFYFRVVENQELRKQE